MQGDRTPDPETRPAPEAARTQDEATDSAEDTKAAPPSPEADDKPDLHTRASDLHARIRALVRIERHAVRDIAVGLAAMQRELLYRELGYAGLVEYGEQAFGFTPGKTRQLARIGRLLPNLSALDAAMRSGALGWTKARTIGAVATPETEQAWVERALQLTSRDLEDLVARSDVGDSPPDPAEEWEPPRHIWARFRLDPFHFERLMQALALLRHQLDDPNMSASQLLLYMAEQCLDGELLGEEVDSSAGAPAPEGQPSGNDDEAEVAQVCCDDDGAADAQPAEHVCGDAATSEDASPAEHACCNDDGAADAQPAEHVCGDDDGSAEAQPAEHVCGDAATSEGASPAEHVCCNDDGAADAQPTAPVCCDAATSEEASLAEHVCCDEDATAEAQPAEHVCCDDATSEDASPTAHVCCKDDGAADVQPEEHVCCDDDGTAEAPPTAHVCGDNDSSEAAPPAEHVCCDDGGTVDTQPAAYVCRDDGGHAPQTLPRGENAYPVNYRIIEHRCPCCDKAWTEGRAGRIEMDERDRALVECDAEVVAGDESAGIPGHLSRTIPPAVRRAVLIRDGGRCQVPGCRHNKHIELHHIDPWARSRSHDPQNLVCLCSTHHALVHKEVLRISRDPDGALRWERGFGEPLGVVASIWGERAELDHGDLAGFEGPPGSWPILQGVWGPIEPPESGRVPRGRQQVRIGDDQRMAPAWMARNIPV